MRIPIYTSILNNKIKQKIQIPLPNTAIFASRAFQMSRLSSKENPSQYQEYLTTNQPHHEKSPVNLLSLLNTVEKLNLTTHEQKQKQKLNWSSELYGLYSHEILPA